MNMSDYDTFVCCTLYGKEGLFSLASFCERFNVNPTDAMNAGLCFTQYGVLSLTLAGRQVAWKAGAEARSWY